MGRFAFARSEATQEMFPSEEGNRRCWLRRCGNVLARLLSRDIIETARRDTLRLPADSLNTIPCYGPSFVGSLSQHRYNKSLLSEEFSLSSSVRPIGMDVNVL